MRRERGCVRIDRRSWVIALWANESPRVEKEKRKNSVDDAAPEWRERGKEIKGNGREEETILDEIAHWDAL